MAQQKSSVGHSSRHYARLWHIKSARAATEYQGSPSRSSDQKRALGGSRNLQSSPTVRMIDFQSLQDSLRFFATTVLAGRCRQLEYHDHRPVRLDRIWGHRLEVKSLVGVLSCRVGTAKRPQRQFCAGFRHDVETLPDCQCVPFSGTRISSESLLRTRNPLAKSC